MTGARDRRWRLVLGLSTLAAAAAVFGEVTGAVRAPVVLWFVLVCPGLAIVRLLRLREAAAELTLAVALSLALAVIVPTTLLYSGAWSPAAGLAILMAVTCGALALDVTRRPAR